MGDMTQFPKTLARVTATAEVAYHYFYSFSFFVAENPHPLCGILHNRLHRKLAKLKYILLFLPPGWRRGGFIFVGIRRFTNLLITAPNQRALHETTESE
jgi:hypothetical protein